MLGILPQWGYTSWRKYTGMPTKSMSSIIGKFDGSSARNHRKFTGPLVGHEDCKQSMPANLVGFEPGFGLNEHKELF